MKAQVFSIYDKKAQYFEKPFTSQNEETAVRLIKNTMSDTNAANIQFVKTPEDFALYHLGEFDDANGQIYSEPIHIMDLAFINNDEVVGIKEPQNA